MGVIIGIIRINAIERTVGGVGRRRGNRSMSINRRSRSSNRCSSVGFTIVIVNNMRSNSKGSGSRYN